MPSCAWPPAGVDYLPAAMKFVCESCSTKYQIAEEKVAGKTLRMNCRKCSKPIIIRGERVVSAPLHAGSRVAPLPMIPRKRKSHPPPGQVVSAESSGNEKKWHVAIQDVPVGPLSKRDVAAEVRKGTVTAQSLVWCAQMTNWAPLSTVGELSALLQVKAVPPAPAAPHRAPPPPPPRARALATTGASAGLPAAAAKPRPAAPKPSLKHTKAEKLKNGAKSGTPSGGVLNAGLAEDSLLEDSLSEDSDLEAQPTMAMTMDEIRRRYSQDDLSKEVEDSGVAKSSSGAAVEDGSGKSTAELDADLDASFEGLDTAAIANGQDSAVAGAVSASPALSPGAEFETPAHGLPDAGLAAQSFSATGFPDGSASSNLSVQPEDLVRAVSNRRKRAVGLSVLLAGVVAAGAVGGALFLARYSDAQKKERQDAAAEAKIAALEKELKALKEKGASAEEIEAATAKVMGEIAEETGDATLEDDTPKIVEKTGKKRRTSSSGSTTTKKELTEAEKKLLARYNSGGSSTGIKSGSKLVSDTSAGGGSSAKPLDGQVIGRIVAKRKPELTRCHERAIRGMSEVPSTKMQVSVSIAPSGKVTRVSANGEDYGGLKTCLQSYVKRWVFPSSSGSTETRFSIVFSGG